MKKHLILGEAQRNLVLHQRYYLEKAIHLLESKIRTDFGVSVTLGAELEFCVKLKNQAVNQEKGNPLKTLPYDAEVKSWLPSREKETKEKDPYFPESEFLSHMIAEKNVSFGDDVKYEAVLSHEANYKNSTANVCHAIKALQFILSSPKDKLVGVFQRKKEDPLIEYIEKWETWRKKIEDKVKEISLRGMSPGKHFSCGLDLNVSLKKDGENLLVDSQKLISVETNIVRSIANHLKESCVDEDGIFRIRRNGLLSGEHENQYIDIDEAIDRRGPNKQEYLEIKLFPSNVDPYFSVMLVLCGIYQSLEQTANPGKVTDTSRHIEVNENGKVECDLINKLEPGLGDKIFAKTKERDKPGSVSVC